MKHFTYPLKIIKTSWFKILFFTMIFLLVVEFGLRLNASLHLSNFTKLETPADKKNARILFFGDSLSSSYPAMLEKKLNASTGSHYKVFNHSRSSLDLLTVLSSLPNAIEDVKPDYVFLMLKPPSLFQYEASLQSSGLVTFLGKIMLGRLVLEKIKQIYLSSSSYYKYFLAKNQKIGSADLNIYNKKISSSYFKKSSARFEVEQILIALDKMPESRKNNLIFFESKFWAYLHLGQNAQAEAMLKSPPVFVSDENLVHYQGYLEYQKKNKEVAKNIFLKLKSNTKTMETGCMDLANYYYFQGEGLNYERTLVECEKQLMDSFKVLSKLGNYYLKKLDIKNARYYANKMLALNKIKPDFRVYQAYAMLGDCYIAEDDPTKGLDLFMESLRINPNNEELLLRYFLIVQKQEINFIDHIKFLNEIRARAELKEQIDYYRNLLQAYIDKKNMVKSTLAYQDSASVKMGVAISLGNRKEADDIFLGIEKTMSFDKLNDYYIKGYHEIFSILRQKKIPIVVLSYPDQELGPLKETLGDQPGVYYFDTYTVFKNSILKKTYSASDLFRTDGFHLTDIGNDVLADALAGIFIEAGLRGR